MGRFVVLMSIGFSAQLAVAAPALVTTTRGPVTLVQGEQRSEAPAPPFLLADGERLSLGDDGLVVVLHEGTATQFHGPADVGRDELKSRDAAPSDRRETFDALLTAEIRTSRAGASRAGDPLAVTRPVPGSRATGLQHVNWSCDGCSPQSVSIYSLMDDADVWSTTGSTPVPYSGPALPPGQYLISVGSVEVPVTVPSAADAEQLAQLTQAVADATVDLVGADADHAAKTSVLAAVYFQAGFATDALYVIDAAVREHPQDTALQELLVAYELRSGIRR